MLACRMLGTVATVGRQGAVLLVQRRVCQGSPVAAASLRQSVIARAMSATAEQVRTAVRALLRRGVDLNTTTERQIREELAQQLGSVEAHKKIIKEEIDTYLTETYSQPDAAAAAAPAADDNDSADDAAPGAKRKRSPDAGTAGKPAKEPRAAAAAGAAAAGDVPGGILLCERSMTYASINVFKGRKGVDVRQYYQAKETGQLAPTKKGVLLSGPEWAAVQAVLPQLQQAVDAGNDQFSAELPNNLRATTSTFQRKLTAGIREYYSEGGELKPGRRGINLSPAALDALIEAVPQLNEQMGPAAAAPPATTAAAAAAPAAARKPAAASSAAAAPAAASGSGGGGGVEEVQLGGRKRAAVSVFKGRPFLDLREMYEKDGQQLPGKKGIALKPDEWTKICGAADAISQAHSSRNTRYKLDLGSNRQVAISEFKGTCYVNVREYYEKNGELLPGSKGLSMSGDQWSKLVAGMAALNAQLGSA